MRLYNDTNIMTSIYESYYTDDFVFKGGKNGFMVAFGLITYTSESDSDYSAYGEIRARLIAPTIRDHVIEQ